MNVKLLAGVAFLGSAIQEEKPTEGEGDEGNPACWQEGFSFQSCCNESYGPGGNAECWDGMHTYQSCCVPGGSFVPPSDFEDLLARGHTGDTSVLPAILQLLSTGGEDCLVTCDSKDSPISGSMWKSFFEASSISKFMRLQPFPAEGDPWRLWTACCSGPGSIKDHVENLAESCRAGAAALVLAILPSLEKNHGREAALEGYMVASQLSHTLEAEDDCRWKHQTNRASWAHFDWFLSPPSMNMPCRGVRIFVDEREASQDLWANSLACADRGLCFTEVWVHEFLRRAECRVDSAEEADFTYVPIYMVRIEAEGFSFAVFVGQGADDKLTTTRAAFAASVLLREVETAWMEEVASRRPRACGSSHKRAYVALGRIDLFMVAAVGTGLLLGAGVRRSGRLGPSGGGAHRERRRWHARIRGCSG
ncbi:unnamed protein product [Effrenium voratum]|uniref:Uncharacterized protein n=1 Tax=Effrenium voratum TaxID=2562239 RepID=A0AA36NEB7_9DINO|nr:unnamed protein product [Effrenium voratum]